MRSILIKRRRLILTFSAFVISLAMAFVYRAYLNTPSDDLSPIFCRAQVLLSGGDPYGPACAILDNRGLPYASYPLPAIILAGPLAPFGMMGEIVLWGIISAVMAFALLHDNHPWRLLAFLSPAYFQAFLVFQLSPLLLAAFCLPALMPLTLAKPHTGLSVILSNLTRRRLLILAGIVLLTLVLDPTWPLRWLNQSRGFVSWVPALSLPFGPLLLLAFLRWKEKPPLFLGLMAVTPQRAFYDLLPLWALAENPRQSLALSAIAWVGFAFNQFVNEQAFTFQTMSVIFAYLPILFLIFRPKVPYFLKRMIRSRI